LKKKKSQQVPPKQLSILEEYILNLKHDSKSTAEQTPASPPIIDPRVGYTSAPKIEMHLNSPNLIAQFAPLAKGNQSWQFTATRPEHHQ
jgi:hypothetical protein